MSTPLAIAAVSAVLRHLLDGSLSQDEVTTVLGGSVTVSVGPPDRVAAGNGNEATGLNLFLYQATPNSGWRNEGLPARDSSGRQRLSNPPLALDLHYMLSAHSGSDLHGEILLGHAMQLLHEMPVLSRKTIQTALNPPAPPAAPTPLQTALAGSGLPEQIEQIKITPEHLGTEELSKLWSATLSHFRPTAAYAVSVVLIQATAPVRTPLPVLSRGQVDPLTHRDRGVVVAADLLPPVPTLEAIEPSGWQPVARLGETIHLKGHHLDGTGRTLLLANDRFEIDQEIPVPDGSGPGMIELAIPLARAADFPVGVYRVGARVQRLGQSGPQESNRLALTLAAEITGLLAPAITPLPATLIRDASGTVSFRIQFVPALRAGQRATLVLGDREYLPESFVGTATTALDFVIADAPRAPAPGLLARLRIDGIDSPIIDRAAAPPVFRNQRILIQ